MMKEKIMKNKDWVLFWLVGLIWGTSFLWIKIAVDDVSPIMLVAFRTLFGSIALGFIVALNKQAQVSWNVIRKRLFDVLIMGTFNIALPWILVSWAGQFIDSGTSAILNGTMPLFTILLSSIIIKDDRVTLPKLGGLVIGFIGIVILIAPSIQGKWSNDLLGQAAILLATISYASATVFARKKFQGLPAQMLALLQLSTGMIIIWLIVLFTEKPIIFPQLPLTWFALIWLGLLGSCIAFIIYFSLLKKIGPTRVSMVTYIPPLVAMILGVVFLKEQFYWQSLLGALLILSGIAIVNLKQKTPQKT
jgi:drug/metabolite transporter (DMT)-like permease